MIRFFLFLCVLAAFSVANAFAYSDMITHPKLSEKALFNSDTKKNNYLEKALLLKDGVSTMLYEKSILQWIQYGAEMEDHPMCRASNHFHNPYLPWTESGLSDTLPAINAYCRVAQLGQYSPAEITSNVIWATGLISKEAAEPTTTVPKKNVWDWENARRYHYAYLTGINSATDTVIAPDEATRRMNATWTFQALGQIMHLLQDTAVQPDFQANLCRGDQPGGRGRLCQYGGYQLS